MNERLGPMIAPLSLSNLLTLLVTFACYLFASRQARGGPMRVGQLAIPPSLAAVVAVVLLAGVFVATWQHDLEWIAGIMLGAVLGHVRGWKLPVSIDAGRGTVVLPRTRDDQLAALALMGVAATDFMSAYLRNPLVAPQHIAALAAFFAGYLGCRALAVAARVEQSSRNRTRS